MSEINHDFEIWPWQSLGPRKLKMCLLARLDHVQAVIRTVIAIRNASAYTLTWWIDERLIDTIQPAREGIQRCFKENKWVNSRCIC